MIDGVTNAGAIPVLERLVQFAGQRHRLITDNVANLSTPGYRPVDVSVDAFREQLGEAIDARRQRHGVAGGHLEIQDTAEVRFSRAGVSLDPQPSGENILFHDGNDRNLERIMQDLVENFMTFRTAAELIRNRFDLLNTAIRERL